MNSGKRKAESPFFRKKNLKLIFLHNFFKRLFDYLPGHGFACHVCCNRVYKVESVEIDAQDFYLLTFLFLDLCLFGLDKLNIHDIAIFIYHKLFKCPSIFVGKKERAHCTAHTFNFYFYENTESVWNTGLCTVPGTGFREQNLHQMNHIRQYIKLYYTATGE